MTSRRPPPYLSFRAFDDRAVLVDHATGDLHLLNAEGGELLERLDRGEEALTEEEEEFVAELEGLGILAGQAGEGTEGAEETEGQEGEGEGEGDLLDELNRWAAGRLIPLHCQLELTYRCALRCRHCYLGGVGGDAGAELTTAEVVRLLDDLRRLGCLFLLLTGGEPFLRPDFEEIFGAARERRFAVSFMTSGWRHDPALLGRLAARGIDAAQVSLYGPDAAAHDAVTGQPGSFEAALACLRLLRDLGVRARAAVTLTALAEAGIEATRELLARERIPAALGAHLTPRRDGRTDSQALAMGRAGLERAAAAFSSPAAPRMAGLGPQDRPCGAGADTLSVDPYGVVHPCLELRVPLGSIRERPVAEIWAGAERLREIRRLTVSDLTDCPACELRPHCNRCAGFAVAEGLPLTGHARSDCVHADVVRSLERDIMATKG